MEVGISTASLFMRATNEQAIGIANDLDARVIEIFLESFSEYKSEFIASLKDKLGSVKVHSLHTLTTQFEPQLFSENKIARRDSLDFMESICKGGREIGAKNYTLHGKAHFKRDVIFNDYPFYVKCFNELCELCESYGVSVCLENVYWAFFNSPEWFSGLKNECEKLRTCLDIKQARLSGYSVFDYISVMEGRINTVHLSDIDENGKMVLPGRGITDFKSIFKALSKAKFEGNMLLEVYRNDYESIDALADSLEYLRKIKNEVFN